MNKAITDGVLLMPLAFEAGLDVWSSGDGTPGSDTYDGAINAAYVPADQDFGGCLELQKVDATQKLRYMGETPLLPGCYLRIRARVKAISGNLPNVRIAAWAGAAGGAHAAGLVEVGPSTTLTSYGNVVTVEAIVGSGDRNGVDMPWGVGPVFGHFGLDLTGATGGVVRIDDIEIEDVTAVFHRTMMSWVDVRDYGAVGDGTTDDTAAFNAADAAANGRHVLVPTGTYHLAQSVTMNSHVTFEGTITMPTEEVFALAKDYHLPAYIDAFGNEELAFKKAFQALLNSGNHESLDLGGRSITVTEPIDVQATVPERDTYATRRHIHNGQFYVSGDAAWEPTVSTSQATYSPSNSRTLTNVTNVANILVGSLVTGNGVGREVYVKEKNEATQELTISSPLYDAEGTQNYTFTRFKYLLDFSGFRTMKRMNISNVDFLCGGKASGLMLPRAGVIFQVRDCFFTHPGHRGITSIGTGCQELLVDRCNFLSSEGSVRVQDRKTIMINTNANDVKLRNNRSTQVRHFALLAGANAVITGNHFFQGDTEADGIRLAGIILTDTHCSTSIDANYVDNCHLEWTNEHSPAPNFVTGFSFSALSITDNVFLSGDVIPSFSYIVIKPHGTGHFIGGLNVTGNKFRSVQGNIDRVDRVDTSFADLNMAKGKNILFDGNTFHAVTTPVYNPLLIEHSENSEDSTWVVDTDGALPFGGQVRRVESVVMTDNIRNSNNVTQYTMPFVEVGQGTNKDRLNLKWASAVRGEVAIKVRMD